MASSLLLLERLCYYLCHSLAEVLFPPTCVCLTAKWLIFMKFWEYVDYGRGKSWLSFGSNLEHILDNMSIVSILPVIARASYGTVPLYNSHYL